MPTPVSFTSPLHRVGKITAGQQLRAKRFVAFVPEMVVLIVGNNPADSLPRSLLIAKQAASSGSVARAIVVADGGAQDQGLNAFAGKIRVRGVSPRSELLPKSRPKSRRNCLKRFERVCRRPTSRNYPDLPALTSSRVPMPSTSSLVSSPVRSIVASRPSGSMMVSMHIGPAPTRG